MTLVLFSLRLLLALFAGLLEIFIPRNSSSASEFAAQNGSALPGFTCLVHEFSLEERGQVETFRRLDKLEEKVPSVPPGSATYPLTIFS